MMRLKDYKDYDEYSGVSRLLTPKDLMTRLHEKAREMKVVKLL